MPDTTYIVTNHVEDDCRHVEHITVHDEAVRRQMHAAYWQ
jgi:hypothetical protein